MEEWCISFQECAQSKSPIPTPHASLIPSQVGFPIEHVALDVLGPLPTTKCGNRYVLVISDYFTRWVEAFSLPNQEAPTVAKVYFCEWVCRFGAPDSIHTDQGWNFESKLFSEICHLLGVEKTRTTPYHPESDRLAECFNRTLKIIFMTIWERYQRICEMRSYLC